MEITTATNSFWFQGKQYNRGALTVTYGVDTVSLGNTTVKLVDLRLDGDSFSTIDEVKTAFDGKVFKVGGGSTGEGVQWSDTSMMPVAGKIPVFSEQGLLSTGMPEFPENAVPLVYLDNVLNSLTGWAIYNDNQYTSSVPLVINQGSRTKITNNSNVVLNSQLPIDVTSWWNSTSNKITPSVDGDSYIVNLRFTASSSSITGLADVELDVGGALGVIDGSTISLRKGSGNTQHISLKFDLYSGSTFLANGGEFYLRSVDGNTSIYDIMLKITRVHKGK
ncbi:MAG: hypothetical protein [Caudoviricetes sp.]|nr:MAG: hypothetical protein [Caudoviricetes sp.]